MTAKPEANLEAVMISLQTLACAFVAAHGFNVLLKMPCRGQHMKRVAFISMTAGAVLTIIAGAADVQTLPFAALTQVGLALSLVSRQA